MNDIVTRLRGESTLFTNNTPFALSELRYEAADEIVRLREDLAQFDIIREDECNGRPFPIAAVSAWKAAYNKHTAVVDALLSAVDTRFRNDSDWIANVKQAADAVRQTRR